MTTWPGELMLAGFADLAGEFGDGLAAGGANLLNAEAENRSHRSHTNRHRLLHIPAAVAHGAHRIGKTDGTGGHVGGILAQ